MASRAFCDRFPTDVFALGADLFVEPQVFGRDGAEDFLGIGLAACDPEQGGTAEVEEPCLQGLVAELGRSAGPRRSTDGARG